MDKARDTDIDIDRQSNAENHRKNVQNASAETASNLRAVLAQTTFGL
jgi:hypothetical protein